MRTHKEDLRVTRTIKAIKAAFFELLNEKDYSEISITELSERACINRKTFYLHYSSMDALVDEIEESLSEEILRDLTDSAQVGDIYGCIEGFYSFLEKYSRMGERFITDARFSAFVEGMAKSVMNNAIFETFKNRTKHSQVLRSYSVVSIYIYRDWLLQGRPYPLEDLIEEAADLLAHGINK